MPAFRLYSQLQTFFGSDGALLSGGYLRFYVAGTTTPADVFGNKALTVNNGNQVDLDASGRPDVEIWGDTDDAFFVELFNASGVKQGEEDDIELPGGAGQVVPIPDDGQFLTGDGTNFLLQTIRQVPDPTGHADDYLSTDGTNIIWVEGPTTPTVPTLPITVGADSFKAGVTGTDFYLQQRGTDSVAGGGGKSVTDSVTFPTAFKTGTTPKVKIQLTGAAPTPSGAYPKHSITAVSATGFTVAFSTLTGGTSADNFSGANLTGTVNYTWVAEGVVPTP